jgi:hypothetical protein
MMRNHLSALALAGVLAFSPGFGSAQVTPPTGGQRQRLELERRLNQGFQRSVQTQLRLDATAMEGLQGIMRSFQEERSALHRAQASLRHRLRDPALWDMTEEDARAFLQEMVDLQERELELYRREQEQLLALLTPVQLLRFYSLREDLGLRVQQLRQRRGRGGGMGGDGLPKVRPGGGNTRGRVFR